MSQEVRITSQTSIPLKPLVQSALRTEVRLLEIGLARTRERLRQFEQRYGISSEEFEKRFRSGELGDALDFIEWAGELELYRLLQAQREALLGAELR